MHTANTHLDRVGELNPLDFPRVAKVQPVIRLLVLIAVPQTLSEHGRRQARSLYADWYGESTAVR